MWRMISRLATTTLTAALAFAGLAALEAHAASVQSSDTVLQPYSYMTNGSVANPTSGAPITFIGAGSQTLTTPGTFALGQFDAANILPASATLTYNNTPFTIDLNVANPTGSGSAFYTYVVSGALNGSITGSGASNMVATILSIASANGSPTTPPFPVSDILFGIPQGINAPNALTGTDGLTTLYAQITAPPVIVPVPAPEPASIAIFGAGLVGWGLRRRMTRSKRLAIG